MNLDFLQMVIVSLTIYFPHEHFLAWPRKIILLECEIRTNKLISQNFIKLGPPGYIDIRIQKTYLCPFTKLVNLYYKPVTVIPLIIISIGIEGQTVEP